jgi:hypothetical protein
MCAMRMTLVDCVSDPGSAASPNEDAAGNTGLSAWVLDGATGLGERVLGEGSDAAWLAKAYHGRLRAGADRGGHELRRLFADLIAEVRDEFEASRVRAPAGRHELPSAGMAFARLRGTDLEYARLGDCRAILAADDGLVLSTGSSPLQELDAAVLGKMATLRQTDTSLRYEHLRRAVDGDLRSNRGLLNTEGGYWVLSIHPEASRHMEAGAMPLDGARSARGLLVSDGFYRLVDTFHAYPDDAALLSAARERGLETMLAELRALEDADPECVLRPRLKPKDDATALLFEVAPPL